MSFKRPYFKNNKVDYGEILNAGKNANINLLKQKSNESGIPVNIADENNNNLFHLALMNSSIKSESKIINFFKYLLSENTSPDMMNIDGMTPLHIACKRQSKKVVNYLLEIGCDINSIDNKGLYPIDYLLKGKYKMFKKEKSITDLYKIELKKELVDDSLIEKIYKAYVSFPSIRGGFDRKNDSDSDDDSIVDFVGDESKHDNNDYRGVLEGDESKHNDVVANPNPKLKFDIIKKFIENSLLNECSRELYIIYKSDIRNSSVIRENIKAIQTKIVDKLLKLDDIKSIDNFESLKEITFVGGADPKRIYNDAKEDYNDKKSKYEEFKKKKEFTDLFNEIFDPKFVYDDKKTELFDTLFEIKKEGNSKFVYSDTKDDNNKLILYGMLGTVPLGIHQQLRNLNGDLHNDIKKLETLKKKINNNFYISPHEVRKIALDISVPSSQVLVAIKVAAERVVAAKVVEIAAAKAARVAPGATEVAAARVVAAATAAAARGASAANVAAAARAAARAAAAGPGGAAAANVAAAATAAAARGALAAYVAAAARAAAAPGAAAAANVAAAATAAAVVAAAATEAARVAPGALEVVAAAAKAVAAPGARVENIVAAARAVAAQRVAAEVVAAAPLAAARVAVGAELKNGPEIQLRDLDQHEERKKKYTKFKNTYLKKVKEVLENYISKVDKVEKLYEIAISLGYINDDTKLNNAEEKFLNIKGVARNIINFVKIAELYNPEDVKQQNINDKFRYVIEDNYASLNPYALDIKSNEVKKIIKSVPTANEINHNNHISELYNDSKNNYKLAALECKNNNPDCIDYLTYDPNKLETFYNNLMLLESRQTTHIRFWKRLKDFFNIQLNNTVNDHFKNIKRQIDSKEDMLEPLVKAKLALDKAKDEYIKTLKDDIKNKDSDTITQVNLIDLLNKINIKSVDKYLKKSTMYSSRENKEDTHDYKIYYKDNNLVIKYNKYDRTVKIKEEITKKTGGAAPAPAPLDINDILDNITIDTIYNSMLMRSSNKIISFENIHYNILNKNLEIFNNILSVKNPTPELKDKLDSYRDEYNGIKGNNKQIIKQLYNWCNNMKEYYDNNKNNMVCNKLFIDTINYLKLKKLKRINNYIILLDYKSFLFELAKSRIINEGEVYPMYRDKLLTLAYADDIDMINFLNIPDFKYIYDAPNIFSEETLKDFYEEQLNCLLHDSLYKILNDTTNIEKINNRVDVYKKNIENEINKHNSDQYDEYMNKSSSQKYIYPSIKEHDIFFCYNNGIINIPYNSITSIFFDDIMKIGPIHDIIKLGPIKEIDALQIKDIPKYEYQFLKYSPNFKRFLKDSYKQFLESKKYKEIVLEDSKLNKMYTVYEMKDVNNYIKDKLIERTYYDILQSIRTKISKLLNNERKRIEEEDIIPKKTGGAEPKYEGEFKLKLSLREKVTCELEMKEKPRLYEVIGKKKNQFIIYDDNYTTIDLEQKLMTFNIKDEIVKKLLEYNPSINYKRLKYIVSNKYNLLQGNNKSSKKIFDDMIEIEENDDIKFYKCIKTDLEKKIKEHYNKYYKDSKKNSIEYFTSNMIEDIEDLINNNSKYTNIFNFNKTGFMIMHYLTNQYFTQHIDKNINNDYDISKINIYDDDNKYFNSINTINELKHYIKKLKLLVIKLENEKINVSELNTNIKKLEKSITNYKNKVADDVIIAIDVKIAAIDVKIAANDVKIAIDDDKTADDVERAVDDVERAAYNVTIYIKNTKKNITHDKKLLTGYHTKIHMGINMLDGWNDLLQDDTILNSSNYLWLYDNIEKINTIIENYNNNNDITDLDNKIKTLNKEILELQKKVYHYNILHKRAEKIHNTITDNYILPEDMLRAVEYDNVNKNIKFMKAKSEKEKVKIMRDEYKDKLAKYNEELDNKKDKLNKLKSQKTIKIGINKINEKKLNEIKDKFEKLHNRGRMYFEDSPFYLQNKAKCFLYELLNYVVQLVIGNNMKTYLLRILYHNRSKEDTKDIENIFDSYKVFDKYSLIEHLQAQSMDMIKSSIDLFENETEKENYEKKSISNIIEDAIDTFILERGIIKADKVVLREAEAAEAEAAEAEEAEAAEAEAAADEKVESAEAKDKKEDFFGIDENIVKLLEKSKKILGEYFESFIPQYIKNLVAVYENNMKFVINHYRLLDMYIKSIN